MDIPNLLMYLSERTDRLFFIFDLKHDEFIYMNPACMVFFGLENREVRPKVLLHMINPADQRYVITRLRDCRDGKRIEEVHFRVCRGAHERWLSITAHLIDDKPKHLLVGIAEDITVIKANIELLNQQNSKKNSILNILAHDLAGPLGTIGNLSELLAKDVKTFTNPTVDRYVEIIRGITKKSIKLIHDFLNHEFLESAGVQLLRKRVDLVSRISLLTAEYFNTQDKLMIAFSCHSNKDQVFAEIDEDKFMQVINNLISNSLKFTPNGGNIDIYIQENKRNIVISVADNGIGIPKKHHAHLFEKFTRARRNGLKGEQSTGLGMSIIKTIVEWHEGKIWFESEEEKGTTFFIELPKR